MYVTEEKSPLKTPDATQERIYTPLLKLVRAFHQIKQRNSLTGWDYYLFYDFMQMCHLHEIHNQSRNRRQTFQRRVCKGSRAGALVRLQPHVLCFCFDG